LPIGVTMPNTQQKHSLQANKNTKPYQAINA
jgi:hypothetical protein